MNKIIHRISYIILCVVCIANVAVAQVGYDEHTWEEDLERALTLLEQSSYYNATEYIQKVIDAKPDESQYVLLLADTYNKARDYNMAAQHYAVLLESGVDTTLNAPALRYL